MLDGVGNQLIIKLRNRSFYLFLLPTIALIGSLLLHNYISNFNYKPDYYSLYKYQNFKFTCNKNNNFCKKNNFFLPVKDKNIGNCGKFVSEININYKNQKFQNLETFNELSNSLINNNTNEKFNLEFITDGQINENCIKNSSLFFLYKIFDFPFQKIYEIKNDKNFQSATSRAVFPFVYGETSISNIVKRFPVNFIFKPLIYISCIFMLLYWTSYNKIVNQIYNTKKINKFFIFGSLSALFLFLHVTFLGSEIDNKIFKLLKKLLVVFFILFEVMAQFYLIKELYKLKERIKKFINVVFLNLKIFLVSAVIIATVFILAILSIKDLTNKVDYILEWNYFMILLFYYLFSFLMWKKKLIKYPPPTQ